MGLQFEWNHRKSAANVIKHGVTFDEATTVFGDPLALTIADELHSSSEDRFITTGYSLRRRLLVVVSTERRNQLRIISARLASRREKQDYEEGKKPRSGQ